VEANEEQTLSLQLFSLTSVQGAGNEKAEVELDWSQVSIERFEQEGENAGSPFHFSCVTWRDLKLDTLLEELFSFAAV